MIQPRLRVLLCTPLPPPYGGVATWSTEILDSKLVEQFEVQVVDIAPRTEGDQRSRFRPSRAAHSVWVLGEFVRQLIQFKPQIVHCSTSYRWGLARDLPMALLAKASGAKTILHTHGGDFHRFLERLSEPLLSLVVESLRLLDCIVVLTYEVKTALENEYCLANVMCIPNFIDTSRFEPEMVKNGKKIAHKDDLEAVFIGWMIEAKGIFDAVRVLARVPGWNVTFVGPKPNDDTEYRLMALARELNVATRMTVLSAVPRADIPAILHRADLFLLPSHREGFPISVLEAMAAGVPVVATDVGAVREMIIHDVTGFVVPLGNLDKMADAIQVLVKDPVLRSKFKKEALKLVKDKYDRSLVTTTIGDLWSRLAGS